MRRFNYILLFSLLIFSCKKENSILGLDVQPENDLLFSSQDSSAKIVSRTVYDTALISSINNLGIYLLGSYQDPVFGRSDAGIYTNFILKDNINSINTGAKAQMDSVVLTLTYKTDFYGDTTDFLKLNVFRLHPSVNLNKDAVYSSSMHYKYDATDITESGNGYLFYPRPASSASVGGAIVKPQLNIKLDKKWFEDNLLLKDDIYLKSSATLQQIFKGLFITTSASTTFSPDYGSILYFSLFDANTKLTLYYHNLSESGLKIDMTCGAGTAHFNVFNHDYGNAYTSLKGQIDNNGITNDTLLGQEQIFVQSMAGLGLKLEFPDIKKYCDSGSISVARAELVLKVDEDSEWQTEKYKTPLSLGIKAYNSDGSLREIADVGGAWIGGGYNTVKKEYVINLPRHISQVCNGQIGNHGFFIFPSESTSKPFRAVIAGSKHQNNPIKLRIYYTKLYNK